MRKTGYILALGLLLAIAAFATVYYVGTASSRELMRQPYPELAWLKKEFSLSDAEFERVATLHRAYLPRCSERCRKIAEQTARLQDLLAENPGMTPGIEAVMEERARMRAECEAEMLRHFLEVSKTMPPEQGRRYLAWVEQQTFMRGEAMEQHHPTDHNQPHH